MLNSKHQHHHGHLWVFSWCFFKSRVKDLTCSFTKLQVRIYFSKIYPKLYFENKKSNIYLNYNIFELQFIKVLLKTYHITLFNSLIMTKENEEWKPRRLIFLECHCSLKSENLLKFWPYKKILLLIIKDSCKSLNFCSYVFSCLPSIYDGKLRQEHQFFKAVFKDKMRTKNQILLKNSAGGRKLKICNGENNGQLEKTNKKNEDFKKKNDEKIAFRLTKCKPTM